MTSALTWRYLLSSFLCCIAALLVNHSGNAHFSILLIFVSAALSTRACSFENPIQMMWMSGHYTFCLMPSAILYISGINTSFSAAIYLSIFTCGFLAMTYSIHSQRRHLPKSGVTSGIYFFAITGAVSLLYITKGGSFLYVTPLLGLLLASHCREGSRLSSVLIYVLFVAYISIYVHFYWSEFGRLVLAGSLLAPLLAVLNRFNLTATKIPLLFLTATGGLFGSLLRIEGATPSTIIRAALRDSAISPLVTAQELLNRLDQNAPIRWREWGDQLILYFLGPLPRQWWPTKPYGFGFQYVVDNYESSYVIAGHSIAATFMGEHIYYLSSPLFFVGAMLSLILVIATARLAESLPMFLGSGSYLIAIYIPTFYWGGLASFSQRFLFGFTAALGLMLLTYMWSRFSRPLSSLFPVAGRHHTR